MKYDEKPNFKIIWLIIFCSPFIVAILVSINIVDLPISNDWIGFYAAIFGGLLSGLLTYYSVYLSINGIRNQINEQKKANDLMKTQLDNDNERYREEQRLNVRPYISEYSGEDSNSIVCIAHIFEVDIWNYTYSDDMILKIKNIGIGPLISFSVTGIRDSNTNNELNKPINAEVKSLEVGGIMILKVSYMTQSEYLVNTLEIEVEYNDILDNQYRQLIGVQVYRNHSNKYQKCRIDSISKQELIIENRD
jgi:hypothetical protein